MAVRALAIALGLLVVAPAFAGRGSHSRSSGTVHVRGYVRKDGTYVAPHVRSAPDGNFSNNWSTLGNVNPYTGEPGTKTVPGASAGTRASVHPSPSTAAAAAPAGATSRTPTHSTVPGSSPQRTEGVPSPTTGALESAVREVEQQRNLETCLDGRYPSLCRHYQLTASEATQVQVAERQRNLETCLDGRYPSLCKHRWLKPSEAADVAEAERMRNLEVCLDGRYPSLCRHHLLRPAEGRAVQDAERQRNLEVCLDGRYPSLCRHDWLSPEAVRAVSAAEGR